jgi:hypothetical protein
MRRLVPPGGDRRQPVAVPRTGALFGVAHDLRQEIVIGAGQLEPAHGIARPLVLPSPRRANKTVEGVPLARQVRAVSLWQTSRQVL